MPTTLPLLLAVTCLPFLPGKLDLTTIERRLMKEPAYRSHLPKYCLLVFGPMAETQTWLVVDGDVLYVDRNGNRDLTEPGECVRSTDASRIHFAVSLIPVLTRPGCELEVRLRDFDVATGKCQGMILSLNDQRYFVGFDETERFAFAQRAETAPIVHVDGPLELRPYGEAPTLSAGLEVELKVSVGTPGLGKGTFCALHCPTFLRDNVPPLAEVSLPQRAAGKRLESIRVPIVADERDHFSGSVLVPADAASGLAKVSMACPADNASPVRPLVLEVPVVASPRRHEAEIHGVKSIDSKVATAIAFANAGKHAVQLHWLDFEGRRQYRHVLQPGETIGPFRTFLTHPWLITDLEGNALEVYFADAQPRKVTVQVSTTGKNAELYWTSR